MMLYAAMPLISRETCGGKKMVPQFTYIVAKIISYCNIFVRCDIWKTGTEIHLYFCKDPLLPQPGAGKNACQPDFSANI